MSRKDALLRMPGGPRIKPGSMGEYFTPEGITTVHSSTCAHCQRGTEFPSLKRMMDYVEICRGCMRLICLECAGKPCRPYEKECERLENEAYIQSQVEKERWGCY
jgi:hypothetical protein